MAIVFLSLMDLTTYCFSPGAGRCSTTLSPSFIHTCARATSSTTDSSQEADVESQGKEKAEGS
ncbi:hypothetical protein HPG69_006438 [Diceros bicornis minor]|uniref:Uncharacterized protein n=1 Tax=Diceros bicornis minor TaxID=77932 RepID=A0A7J7EWV4_DICBM|nr:hypothetical protein HPG69_006438 [Diceros bicornis minor]